MKTILLTLLMATTVLRAADGELMIGVGKVDITPDYPVRLNGFGFRREQSEGVTHPIYAKALAFGNEKAGPALLITVDNLCFSLEIIEEITGRLNKKIGINPERIAFTATHTHTAPMLKGVAPTIFSVSIPAEHQTNIDRYTREFIDKVEGAAVAALSSIRPAKVSWGIGNVGLAINRRTKDGPTDHDMPVMVIREADGKPRAIWFSYACHCVALSNNKVSGDWAGFAQSSLEKNFPGAVALASIGCGADQNPNARADKDDPAICVQQGEQIVAEVKRIIDSLKPMTSRPEIRRTPIEIAFDTPRTRAEWEERTKSSDKAIAYQATLSLAKLDRGETLPASMKYIIQTWFFGEQLAVVFLPGETVVDYSLRLKKEFDRTRLWVNGYSNEGRCYVPSERILKEGGYEGGGAMVYYDRPNRFAPGLEQKIIDVVHAQVPKAFLAK